MLHLIHFVKYNKNSVNKYATVHSKNSLANVDAYEMNTV